jgi:2-polyprenyl-6-methoxyphenol hydroxylase-like FAD-dependent oxidoreductase
VIEAKPPPRLADIAAIQEPDLRVFAITPASTRVFQAAGAWDLMASVRAPAFRNMQVWDALGPGYVRFDAGGAGAGALGHIVENRVLQSALYERLLGHAQTGRVELACPATITRIRLPATANEPAFPGPVGKYDTGWGPAAPSSAGSAGSTQRPAPGPGSSGGADVLPPHALAEVVLADGRTLRTRLLVGADGATSRVRDAARIGTWGWDYDQRGVVATIVTPEANDTAWQRFLPNGPVAVLPVSGVVGGGRRPRAAAMVVAACA